MRHVDRSSVEMQHTFHLASIVPKQPPFATKANMTVQPVIIHLFVMLCCQRSHFAFDDTHCDLRANLGNASAILHH